jgi:hypothetical protein
MHDLTPRWRIVSLMALALALFVVPVGAHHGWGGYQDNESQITGTVTTAVSTGGPHASLKIRAADGQIWNVLLAPPPRTVAAGLKEGMIPLGAEVTAFGHRHRDGKVLEIKTERLSWNGKTFNVYPNR